MKNEIDQKGEKCPNKNDAVQLTDKKSGRQCDARLSFISCRSMYLEADSAFKPGNMIEIQFDFPPLDGSSTSYSAIVYWCMLLSENESISKYGIGVKYFQSSELKQASNA
jgi:hypothetical protein